MNKKIVVITSHHFYNPTRQALKRLELEQDITVVPYDNFEHIAQVYEEYAEEADGFLVSGSSAKSAIEMSISKPKKPIYAFQVDSSALYKDLLILSLENRQQDFSRVIMDFLLPFGKDYSVLDYLHRSELDSVYTRNTRWIQEIGVQEVGGAENSIMGQILELWNARAIDMVICMYSSLAPALEALHIPYRCPFLSDQQLANLIHQVETKIEIEQLRDNMPAIVQLMPASLDQDTEETLNRMEELTRQFLKENLIECVLQKSSNSLILFTSVQTLRVITEDYETCLLSSYLNSRMDCTVIAGYGIGATMNHAQDNVHTAMREAKFSGHSFLKDASGNLIGPLGRETRMVVDTQAASNVTEIAKRCNLSTMTVQKLLATLKQSDSNKITSPELAKRFGITIRNANRIITNLKIGGVATPIYTQTTNSRGRPVQVYALDFSEKNRR